MTAEILAVGTELLLGDITNTNAQYLARELAALGIGVLHQSVVGDNPGRLKEAIRTALSRSDILITTGGLGPTGDDITRETVAEVMGQTLIFDEESYRRMENYFCRLGRKMAGNNRKQAMLPEGCTIFQNDFGTAPGCAAEKDGKIAILLPGPPREMKPMFDLSAKPYLQKFSDAVIESVNLRIIGIGESTLQEMLEDLMSGSNPTLSPYAKDGEVQLRVTARAKTAEEALALCRPIVEEVKRRTAPHCYGENVGSLHEAVVERLKRQGRKLAAAESCTGGMLCERITSIAGSSEVFDCGIVSYANAVKTALVGVKPSTLQQFGAVSRETACEMAEGVRRVGRADLGVGITGIAGPGGGTPEKPVGLVYAAVSDGKNCYVRRLLLGHGASERDFIRTLACLNALEMVRRFLDLLPQVNDAECVPAETLLR